MNPFKSKKKLSTKYIFGQTKFNSLPELIERYQQEQGSLCCRLNNSSWQESAIKSINAYLLPQSYEESGFWNIAEADLTFGKQLGRGSFGEVLKCYLSSNPEIQLAIKFLKPMDNDTEDLRYEFDKETDFMKNLANQFIVKFYG